MKFVTANLRQLNRFDMLLSKRIAASLLISLAKHPSWPLALDLFCPHLLLCFFFLAWREAVTSQCWAAMSGLLICCKIKFSLEADWKRWLAGWTRWRSEVKLPTCGMRFEDSVVQTSMTHHCWTFNYLYPIYICSRAIKVYWVFAANVQRLWLTCCTLKWFSSCSKRPWGVRILTFSQRGRRRGARASSFPTNAKP